MLKYLSSVGGAIEPLRCGQGYIAWVCVQAKCVMTPVKCSDDWSKYVEVMTLYGVMVRNRNFPGHHRKTVQ